MSLSRFLIRTTLLFVVLGFLGLGFRDLEPVKTSRLLRQTRSWMRSPWAEPVERKAVLADYDPVALSGTYPQGKTENALRLMDLDLEPGSPSSPREVSVYLDGQRRHAVAGAPPFDFSYRLRVPRDGRLWLGVNHEDVGSEQGEISFDVLVSSTTGDAERVYQLRRPSSRKGWEDASIDLGAFSGQDVRIEFRVSSTLKSASAYWAGLFLRSEAESAKKPNVFLVLIDTLRPDHLSGYGYHRPTSPNIDELMKKGVRFENAYSAAPWTNPSILALFTGRYPSDLWEPKPHKEAIKLVVPSGADTIAEILSRNGYLTIGASDHPGINYKLFGQGFDLYSHLFDVDGPWTEWRETDSENVLEQLHDLLEGRPKQGVFTYIHLIYPHQPYEPPPPYDDWFGRGTRHIERAHRASVINMYDGDIRHTDEVVKDLLADVEALGLGKDSIVVLLSDHGEGFWEHGLWEHGNSLYNELLHIPLVFHAPGRIPENRSVRELVRNTDVLPTILDLAGIRYDENNFRGTSLLPLMKNGEDPQRVAFSEFPHSKIVLGRSLQSLTEKLIDSGEDGRPREYYDVGKDSHEQHDLSESRSSKVADLLNAMNDISRAASQSRAAHPAVGQEPSEDTLRRLKALGYIE